MNNLLNKLNPIKTALLLIDMEKAFVEPGAALYIAGAKATVPQLAETLQAARTQGVKVIWVKREYAADGSDMEKPRWRDLVKRGYGSSGVLAPDSHGLNSVEEPDGLVRLPDETVVIKSRFSAFFKTELDHDLRASGIDTVVLTGTTTPNCIRSTAFDALSLDYRVIVLAGCTSSATPEIQQANLADMERVGIEIWE